MAILQKIDLDNKHKNPQGIEDLVKQIQIYYPSADLDMIHKAYTLAKRAHTGQYRKDGSPFMCHPLCVASILADLKLDLYTIVTGLLHDVVEDTSVDLDTIKEQFNDTVAFLVDGVSKVSQIQFKDTQKKDSENMRKMIVAMACDVRVILVKIADRLHNMRTLAHLPPEKRLKVAQETLDIYAPLASRLGIHSIKVELEDLAFQHSDSEAYYSLMKQIDSEKKDMQKYIAEVLHILEKEITTQMNMKVEVTGRPKNLYSIYQKMLTQNVDYNEVYDILAFRVCVDKVEECYKVLGLIHSLWKPIPGRFKDYIAIPKQNSYQSLHTTVLGEKGKRIEIQIRTHAMHILAERGIAAHWKYKTEAWKNKTTLDNETLKQFNWLQDLVSLHRQNRHSGEFLESVKIDLFDSDIYIFTPGGDVKEFPKGATPIDFAYCIHTDLGHRITGAKVNGRLVPLKYKLRNGDTVEVITSKNQTPSEEWVKYCVTSKAKSKIKSFLKMEGRKRALEIGQRLMEKEMRNENLKIEDILKMPVCIKYMKEKGINTKEDLYTQLGYGKLLVKDLITTLLPEKKKEDGDELDSSLFPIESTQKKRSETFCPVIVEGLGNILVHFAKCCRPLPGDAITGFISRGKGIVIHRQACHSLLSMDSERYVDVQWNQDRRIKHKHIVNIRVVSHDVPGVLKNFSEVFAEQNMNICNLKVSSNKDMKAVSIFSAEVQNLKQLQMVIRSLKSLKNVISVSREGTTT
ncbi:MAG: bifunctional (p)ppGpp synthetase/guanosine-3',5'-bis(diphosphate) 3'-pyrophosphohydrolase [Bdellovibrionales bacterium]|nr:bifunctional (p)ppGpp synthetase/guanosine-3',5'-bis(diphosphate) 3'-pyrophosphohydrolase [Bdellovibrionales bacterium]